VWSAVARHRFDGAARRAARARERGPSSRPEKKRRQAAALQDGRFLALGLFAEMANHWHHGPLHLLLERGVYMVTAGTYLKAHHFRQSDRLKLLHDQLQAIAEEYSWELEAWAVLSNHYHFVARSPDNPGTLKRMLGKLHTLTAKAVNLQDQTPGRKVWHQYWDTRLTFERSYFARLNYVHQNPVHHRIVTHATAYPWCSARQFEAEAPLSFQQTIASMPIDDLSVVDDF
jgi:putative transposase